MIAGTATVGGAESGRKSNGEAGDGGAEVRFAGIPELDHERVSLECLLDDSTLDPLPATVDQAHLAEALLCRGGQVLGDDRRDIARGKCVQVERGFDGNMNGIWVGHAAVYDAVTTVVMPPRAEKSPTTVMRLGRHAATRSSRIWFVTSS